ncbi:MAG: SH3 domain-containing protein [Alphaproteobacteria bacterium]
MSWTRVPLCLLFALCMPVMAIAASEADSDSKVTSGLPVPRFASLRSNEVNMRTGPGTRYPIEWVFKRQGLPVEIIAEYEIWRRVKDSEGAEGWVHKSALIGKRAALITGSTRDLHESADVKAPVVARLEVGALGQLVSCSKDWCKLKVGDIKGYLRKTDFWGTKTEEMFD